MNLVIRVLLIWFILRWYIVFDFEGILINIYKYIYKDIEDIFIKLMSFILLYPSISHPNILISYRFCRFQMLLLIIFGHHNRPATVANRTSCGTPYYAWYWPRIHIWQISPAAAGVRKRRQHWGSIYILPSP